MGRSEKYNDDFPLLAEDYARQGMKDIDIARKLGISKQTFYNYQKIYIDFLDSIKKGGEKMKTRGLLYFLAKILGDVSAQRSEPVNLSPAAFAPIIERVLLSEGHLVKVKAKETMSGWDFEIDLLRDYTKETMPAFFGALIGTVESATQDTRWKVNRVYLSESGRKVAWITTKACRDIACKMRDKIDDTEAFKLLVEEIHMLVK